MFLMGAIVTNDQANDDRAKYIALVTCLMSIPLLFPPEILHGLLLNWWLLSIYVVPALTIAGLIILLWNLLFSGTRWRPSLGWNLLGVVVGVIAVVVEMTLIRMPSALP
jgi:hypothetical protein